MESIIARPTGVSYRVCETCGQTGRYGVVMASDGTPWHAYVDPDGAWIACGRVTEHRALAGRNYRPPTSTVWRADDDESAVAR